MKKLASKRLVFAVILLYAGMFALEKIIEPKKALSNDLKISDIPKFGSTTAVDKRIALVAHFTSRALGPVS